MIVNVRGTSGSGKTELVRRVMSAYTTLEHIGPVKKPDGYVLTMSGRPDLYVVGSYQNVCGGCDGIKTQDEICDRVRRWAPQGNVLLEGLLMSHLFSRYADLARELRPINRMVFAFLDTPLELCLDRVRRRREERAAAAGREAGPLNPKNTETKWRDCRRCHQKFKDTGLDARWVSHLDGVEQVLELLA